jgi:hypothetical protein
MFAEMLTVHRQVYFTQNIPETELHHTERGKENGKDGGGGVL